MPSWVAALMEVPEDWIAHLGGWSVSGTASRYVGTVERRIKTMQSKVASELRKARGGIDGIDEDGLLFMLGRYLIAHGYSKEDAEDQLMRLNWFGGRQSLEEESFGDLAFDGVIDDGFGVLAEEVEANLDDDEDIAENGIKKEFMLPAVRESMKKSLPQELLGKFAISISLKTGRRCLHLLGACHRIPGLHYEHFEVRDERPAEDSYHGHCGQCWKVEAVAISDAESDGSSSTNSES